MARIASARRSASRAGAIVSSRNRIEVADALADLERRDPLGRKGRHRPVDLLEPEVDHLRRAPGRRAAPDPRATPSSAAASRSPPRPSRRRRHGRRGAAPARRAARRGSCRAWLDQLASAPRRAKLQASRRQADQHQSGADQQRAERSRPAESRLAIGDPADRGRDAGWVRSSQADDQGETWPDRIDEQPLADAPGC